MRCNGGVRVVEHALVCDSGHQIATTLTPIPVPESIAEARVQRGQRKGLSEGETVVASRSVREASRAQHLKHVKVQRLMSHDSLGPDVRLPTS